MKVNIYLNFNRNTEEAFNFYKSIFGGEFLPPNPSEPNKLISRFGDNPSSEYEQKEEDKNLVMHVALPLGENIILMGTDAPESTGFKLNMGNNVYISLHPKTKEEGDILFAKLSEGGKVEMPLTEMFWNAYFGSLTDKFGVQWMMNIDK